MLEYLKDELPEEELRDLHISASLFRLRAAILKAALELFSVQGFEATSFSQIAGVVGIRKASLYSHFENKQAILDALVQEVLEQYEEHSIFAKENWEKDAGSIPKSSDDAAQMIQEQIRYILHDPIISRARKMLVIEQFQNPALAKLQTKQNYSDVLGYFTGLMKQWIQKGVLAEGKVWNLRPPSPCLASVLPARAQPCWRNRKNRTRKKQCGSHRNR